MSDKNSIKKDLADVTFVIPLRIDSKYRKANMDTLIMSLGKEFHCNIIILEADIYAKYVFSERERNIKYKFIRDNDPVFHRTKYINELLHLAETDFVGVWDTDVIAFPEQIIETVDTLKKTDTILAFPYDGRFYRMDSSLSHLFRRNIDYAILKKIENALPLMFGYHSVGGAFLVNRKKYIDAGGENEKIYGWGPEDVERVKRLEILNHQIYRTIGGLFHLWHPIGSNSMPANENIKMQNIKELLKVCSIQ